MARGRPSKRQLIVDTAFEVFAERGYQGTSIDLVVQVAGVSKPTVYNNFPSKLALLLAVLEQQAAELSEHFSQAETEHSDGLERILAFYRALVKDAARLAIYRIFLGEEHKLSDELKAAFADYQSQIERWVLAQAPNPLERLSGSAMLLQGALVQGLMLPALMGMDPDEGAVRSALSGLLKRC